MADYAKLKKAELKDLLRDRGLRVGGYKEELIKRLSASDAAAQEYEGRQQVFRFLDLPPEIRCMIYEKIAAHPDNWCEYRNLTPFMPNRTRSSVSVPYANHRNIAQPTIFHICKQIRSEGLDLFYKGRDFQIDIAFSRLALKAIMRWLDAIGESHRLKIGQLTLIFDSDNVAMPRLRDVLTWFLAKLSKDAKVVCSSLGTTMAKKLWKLGNELHYMYQAKIPMKLLIEGQPHNLDVDITEPYIQGSVLKLGPGGFALGSDTLDYVKRMWT